MSNSKPTIRNCLLAGLVFICAAPAQAAFHLWDITEVYSNADGSVQFIELFTTFNSQHLLGGHTLVASSDGNMVTLNFTDLPGSSTGNRSMLLATPGFANLPGGIQPDYEIPAMFFNPAATTIILNFAEGQDVFMFGATDLPTDGTNALLRNLTTAVNSPENFSGDSGAIVPPIFVDGFED